MQRRHAVIAGTGRSGTTFLMQFLSAAGVPTADLSRLHYDREARAGLEQSVLANDAAYLVKDPMFHEYADLIDPKEITIDCIIVPVRHLRDAAASRVTRERASRFNDDMPEFYRRRQTHGTVPGGVVYSLSQVDQERILAVGFHQTIEWALSHDIPLYLLHFPRVVKDAEYVVSTLWPWLQKFADRSHAIDEFKKASVPSS